MKQSSKKLNALIFVFFYFALSTASAKESDTPPFFKISFKGHTAYLLGSVHVGEQDFYPLPNLIKNQLKHSNAIVLEAVPSAEDQHLITKYSLRSETYKNQNKAYDNYCKTHHRLCAALSRFSPWVQATQITLFRLNQLGYHANLGIESHLIENKGSKLLLQLESTEFQLKLMSEMSKDIQESMLTQSITASDSQVTTMFAAWRRGDLNAIDALSQDELKRQGDQEFIDKLLWQRNKSMASSIIDKIQERSKYQLFIAVGAAHLAGEKSINQYLKKAGAKVESCWGSPSICQ
ncbi:TraB/GumN family protein [Shewanella sp. OPT22]|nr:TraB/GumN family protein [Shewanella sp. OPT22]